MTANILKIPHSIAPKTTNIVKRRYLSSLLPEVEVHSTGFSIFANESTMKGWSELV